MKEIKPFWIVLIVNVLFIAFLTIHPDSELHTQGYHISKDTPSYTDPPEKGIVRTVGYPLLLNLAQLFDSWYMIIVVMNCLLGAWLFWVTKKLIGNAAWILFALGSYTIYTPLIMTDLLFATLFVTSIYHLKEDRLGYHFILLGISSLIRPSLAWFFLIEPLILYFYGYRGKILWISGLIVFGVTSFNPIRNLVNHGIWTHSTILKWNIESDLYFASRESIPKYFIHAFRHNFLNDHYRYIGPMFGIENGHENCRLLQWGFWVGTISMMLIWIRFTIEVINRRINLGDIIILAYFIAPTLFGASGPRLALPVQWILLL